MKFVAALTEQQKTSLEGQLIQPDWYFYPVQDGNTPPNWIITEPEIINSIYPQNEWVKTLTLIEWVPPTNN